MPGLVIQGYFQRGVKVPAQLPAHLSRLPVHGGQPLPADVRQRMESTLGQRFDQVRVHVGPHVQAVGALAFTQGSNIHFAPGQYNPSTPQGRQMLAHELAHVVQQRSGRVQNPFGTGVAVVQDQRLEAEAERMAQRVTLQNAAQPAPVRPNVTQPKVAQPNAVNPNVAQPYSIVPSDRILTKAPAKRPWYGYPYVVRGHASFPAQQKTRHMKGKHEFLKHVGGNTVTLRQPGSGLTLRLSDDCNMAIEDSNLKNRQPKCFYATAAVISAANQELQKVNSIVTLQQTTGVISVITGWWSAVKVLYRVEPQFSKLPKQNCNDFSEQVTGAFTEVRGGNAAYNTMNRLFDEEKVENLARSQDYVDVSGSDPDRLRDLGANRHARAGVGEAFMITSIGKPEKTKGKFGWVRDIRSGELRKIAWPYHYAGVVAKSGTDTITLENYARGDDRKGGFDPRWYFQMYGTSSGQSFHEQHDSTGQYANALTVVARQDDEELPNLGPVLEPLLF